MTSFIGVFELRHINLRKEGPEATKEPAMDLKFTGKVPADLIDGLVCGEDDRTGEAKAAFWREDGAARFFFGDIKFFRQIEHANAVLDGIEILDVKVKSFSFSPSDKFEGYLTFSISSNEPPGRTLGTFAEQLQENMKVTITVPQGDLFAGGDDDPRDAADRLGSMAQEDGGATLGSGGKVLAQFGK